MIRRRPGTVIRLGPNGIRLAVRTGRPVLTTGSVIGPRLLGTSGRGLWTIRGVRPRSGIRANYRIGEPHGRGIRTRRGRRFRVPAFRHLGTGRARRFRRSMRLRPPIAGYGCVAAGSTVRRRSRRRRLAIARRHALGVRLRRRAIRHRRGRSGTIGYRRRRSGTIGHRRLRRRGETIRHRRLRRRGGTIRRWRLRGHLLSGSGFRTGRRRSVRPRIGCGSTGVTVLARIRIRLGDSRCLVSGSCRGRMLAAGSRRHRGGVRGSRSHTGVGMRRGRRVHTARSRRVRGLWTICSRGGPVFSRRGMRPRLTGKAAPRPPPTDFRGRVCDRDS